MRLPFFIASLFFVISGAHSVATYPTGSIEVLNDDWKFIPNQLLNLQEILNKNVDAVPITVPGTWNSILDSGKGYGTYYKKINLDSFGPQSLAINIPAVGLSYRLYINDELLGEVGKLGKSLQDYTPAIRPTIYNLPENTRLEDAYIIVQVCNFHHQNGGLWFSPTIGPEKMVRADKQRKIAIDLIILGAIAIIGLYHLFLFFIRVKDKYGVYFFFISLCLMAQVFSKGEIPILSIFPEIPWFMLLKMDYASIFTVSGMNALFIYSLYPTVTSRTFVRAVAYVCLSALIFLIVSSTHYAYYLVIPFQIIIVVVGIYLIYVLINAYRYRLNGSAILLFGLLIAFLSVVNDILMADYIIDSYLLTHFGTLVYVITLSMVVAKRFATSMEAEEQLAKELEIANQELEYRVNSRTEELKAQKEVISQQNTTLTRVNAELKQLMAIVAHDLKSPLSKIFSISEVMRKGLDGKMAVLNDHISQVALEGTTFIDDLMVSRSFEIKGKSALFKQFNYQKLVLKKIEEFKSSAERKNLELRAELEPVTIKSDDELVSRIIENLLSNAIKFSPKGKSITISLYKNDLWCALSIKDEGPGFTMEDKRKLFKSFQRLSARPTDGESSSGLGLSIVKSLTDELDGAIELYSETGKGAEFVLKLPLNIAQ